MIESKELRIGNYVHEKHYGLRKVVKIDNRDGYDNLYRDAYGDASGGIIKPIPLTEEWLVKFGFEYWSEHDDYIFTLDGYTTIGINKIDLSYGLADSFKQYEMGEYFSMGKNIKHVHQLQNLYHALTGEELEIK